MRLIAILGVLLLCFSGAAIAGVDEPVAIDQIRAQGVTGFQVWNYTTDPGEYLTCIAYYAHPGTRFTKPPVFQNYGSGDRTGWTSYMSPDAKAVYIYGQRTHFGPVLATRYTIAYAIYYEDMDTTPGVGQDTVVWDGSVRTFSWSRTGFPGDGGTGSWSFSPYLYYPNPQPLTKSSIRADLTGEVNSPGPGAYVGETMQVGPAMFGAYPGPWGTLSNYTASSDVPPPATDTGLSGWAMNGTITYLDTAARVHVSEGDWWLYDTSILSWPVEQGAYIITTRWENGWENPAIVSGRFYSDRESTVVSPPWPIDYLDWSYIGTASFNGTFTNPNLLEGEFLTSRDKLVLKDLAGRDVVFAQHEQLIPVELHQQDMRSAPAGYQAFLDYDTNVLEFVGGAYDSASPYTLPAIVNIQATSAGEIDIAAGVNVFLGQSRSAKNVKLAEVVLRSLNTDCITELGFRDNDPASMFTDSNGNLISAQCVDGPVLIIDGTPPTDCVISADPAGWANVSVVHLSFSALDALSGMHHYEISYDSPPNDSSAYVTATSVYDLDVSLLSDGPHFATVRAFDKAGNYATATTDFFIDRSLPTITIDSAKQAGTELLSELGSTANAVQGIVDIYVTASDTPSGLGGAPVVTVTPNGGSGETATLIDSSGSAFHYQWQVTSSTPNGVATINATVTDSAGNESTAPAKHFNVNKSRIAVTLELENASVGPIQRWIKFQLGGTGGSVGSVAMERLVTFVGGIGTVTLENISNAGAWSRLSAKDEQHTLRRSITLGGGADYQFTADFTGAARLTGGDITNDNLIDIRDFGLFAGQLGTSPSLATKWPVKNADIDCGGSVWTEDFTYISNHFLLAGDAQVAGTAAQSASLPMSSITLYQLSRIMGSGAIKADLNLDKVVDIRDVKLLMQKLGRRR